MDRREVHRLGIARITHVSDHDAPADASADVGIPSIDHDLHPVSAAALVGVAHKRDVAGALGRHHGLPSLLFGRLIRPLPGRIGAMPNYVMLANWTDQGMRNIEDSPKRI